MCQLNILDYAKLPGGCGHLWIQGVEQCSEAEENATRCKALCEDLARKVIIPKTPLFKRVKDFFKGGDGIEADTAAHDLIQPWKHWEAIH
ncbi:hypothetical protein N7451_005711 [Penicillium sp. IBT 35674x]|nr:hypothetical protein N7451_005711 [Penicillium sp. IBT 35674x]